MNRLQLAILAAAMACSWPASLTFAQAPAVPGLGAGRAAAPQFVSPEVSADRKITLRIYAPQAQSVRLNASDIPGVGFAAPMARGDNGVWEVVAGPVPAGAYRYAFNRTMSGRANTAIAGLSMGGSQTLNVAFENPSTFGYIGVYSSGLFGVFPIAGRGTPPPSGASGASDWETRHAAALGDADLKKGLRLFWFSTGSEDFLLNTTVATVDFFKKHGFTPIYEQSAGGHTWLNWRNYLTEFAPKLFQ